MSTEKNDVVIVGAGAIGCSIAYHLGKHGVRTTLVERESIGTRASGKAWAVISYPPASLAHEGAEATVENSAATDFSDIPLHDWFYLLQSSFARMPNLALEIAEHGGVDVEYGESLNTHLVTEEQLASQGRDELLAPYRRAGGVETGWLDAAQLREVFPSLAPKWCVGLTNPEAQVEPYKYTLGLAQAAESLGATVKQGDAVGFETRGDRITGLTLATGELIQGDHFVIAAGPWSRPVASHLGVDLPMRVLMAECIRVEVPGGLPSQTLVAGDYWIIPRVNGDVILGPYLGSVSPRDNFDDSLTEELKPRTLTACTEVLPALEDAKLLEHRGDLLALPVAPPLDKPTLGRLPGLSNGYIATHFGGLGISMSPAAGELMAELIVTGRPPLRAAMTLDHLKLES
jgi:glycine/D-amino acid oxidase-like deaminating enzyme